MINKKEVRRKKIRSRIRRRVKGTAEKPRLSVFRSNKQIYAQVIDDIQGITIVSASSALLGEEKSNKKDQSEKVGQMLAEKALAAGISEVVFDRGGYLYHGRVKSLADGARNAGLKF
ncbi:MAG TPA: 50S ribosomal protein L18 [Bacteroidia bacterium]|nr:50S ribosomal protein L18 [Bacteroidia bacterium]HNT80246.1 50S ribosomal protein L18 [Bacteroidia bacterium]